MVTTLRLRPPLPSGRWLVGVAIILLAINLRLAVGSLGVVLTDIRDDLGMSAALAGALTTVPVICFAVFGIGSHSIVRQLGLHRTSALLLVMIAVGLVLRAVADNSAVFILCTTLALAGAAIGNIILPPLVKVHFPDRIALMSALYGAALMTGTAIGSVATVPFADALGGWRPGLGIWAVVAVVGLLPWLAQVRRDVHTDPIESQRIPIGLMIRSPLAWAMALMFAAQSAQAYAQFGWFPKMLTDAGVSDARAGALLGALSAVTIPLTLALPWLIRLAGDRPILPISFALLSGSGWVGLLVAPASQPFAWAMLLGLGGGAFTWTLAMIGQRTRTAAGTTALSVFTQGVGYILAGIGPFGVGFLHDVTGSWSVALVSLIVLAGAMGVVGTIVVRCRSLEDTIRQH